MPTAAQIAAIYDFKNLLERALAAVFTANGIKNFTSQSVGSTGNAAQDAALEAEGFQIMSFQRDRPRAEIDFTPGAGQGRWHPLAVDGVKVPVESCWSGTYRVLIVTKPDIREHNAFVCLIRFLMQTMGARINNVAPLTAHCVAPQFRDTGTTPTTKSEDGAFETLLQYDLTFSVQADAWADLAT